MDIIRRLMAVMAVAAVVVLGAVPAGAAQARPHGWHLIARGPAPAVRPADSATFNNLDSVFLNGSGSGCANYTHIIGWPVSAGTFPNEIFNTYVDSSGQYYELQAAWCANNGAYHGQCIWDNSTSNHGLVLYPCSPSGSIDQFYAQLNNSQGIYQFINLAYRTYVNCTQYQGQWCWDGGYVRYQADWNWNN